MSLDKSNLVAYIFIVISFILVWKYGLDHTSYLGYEIPIFTISIMVFLLVQDYLKLTVFYEIIQVNDTRQTVYFMISGLVIILSTVFLLESFTSFRENRLLSLETEITEGKFLWIAPKFMPSSTLALSANIDPRVYVYYSYNVQGIRYVQADSLYFYMDKKKKMKQHFDIRYSIHNPQVSKIIKHPLN